MEWLPSKQQVYRKQLLFLTKQGKVKDPEDVFSFQVVTT